jgi:hypothetical protein
MNILVKIICLLAILFSFSYCNRQKTYNIIPETNENIENIEEIEIITDVYTKYISRFAIFDGSRYHNRSPNIFNNAFSEFQSNTNFITVDDPEYRVEKLYLDGNFSPIGWSRKGHFAYARFKDEKVSSVTIFNIITDEILEYIDNVRDYTEYSDSLREIYGDPYGPDYNYEIYQTVEDLNENYKISFEEFWAKYNSDLVILLKKYEIISFEDFKLFDINTLNEKYNLEIIIEDGLPREEEWGWNEPRIEQGKNIIIKNAHGGRKIIGDVGMLHFGFKGQVYDWGRYSVLDFVGYYEYPFEDRIVFYFYDRVFIPITRPQESKAFKFVVRTNFEGLAGCHLLVGFE